MDDLPRQKLREIIAKYGSSLCDEPLRCEGLLRDLCPKDRRKVNVLINALRERVPTELGNLQTGVPVEVALSRLSKRLEDQHAITPEMARWAVESWALALNKISPEELTYKTSEQAAVQRPGQPPPSPGYIRSAPAAFRETGYSPTAPVPTQAAPTSQKQKRGVKLSTIFALASVVLFILGGLWITAPEKQRVSESSPTATPELAQATSSPAVSPYVTNTPYVSTGATATPLISTGELWISTDPAEATAILDGVFTRTTPATFSNLSTGIHHVKILLDGYQSEERDIYVTAGQVTAPGKITLLSDLGQFAGVWVGNGGVWNAVLTITAGGTASMTLDYTERLRPGSDHWNNIPPPYNRSRTLHYQWTATSNSVQHLATTINIYWNEWKSSWDPSGIPYSVLKKITPRPPHGQFNTVYPPSTAWSFTLKGAELVGGPWTFHRKR